MRRLLTIAGCLTLLVIVVSACGGGEPEESSFKPRPVPSEYQGLSMDELKARSKAFTYQELIPGGGDWREDKVSEDNLRKLEGELG